jgi:tetratricopeptide (TPR) repeat protein
MKLNRMKRSAAVSLIGVIVAATVVLALAMRSKPVQSVTLTVGDIHVMHAKVSLGEREVRGHSRLADGDAIVTASDGRARIRLDNGAVVVVDASTRLTLHQSGINVSEGRVFVQGDANSRTEVTIGTLSTIVSSSTAAIDARQIAKGVVSVYCAQGELLVGSAGQQSRVASGETVAAGPQGMRVTPEKAFDDWTGGLLVPWAEEAAHRSAIAETWGGRSDDDPGIPLVIRSQKIEATLDGELAVTNTRTRFFNGTDNTVRGDIRMAVPAGAILSRVALRQGESEVSESDAVLQPSKPATQLTALPGQLNWAGDGWLRGSLPAIAAGTSLELVVEYVEWLSTQSGATMYRFPMARAAEAPTIGELSATIDATRTSSSWLRANLGAVVHDRIVELHRADARPGGDLVVEFAPDVVAPNKARAYVQPGEKGQDPYILIRTEVPERAQAGVDLGIVVDTSMSARASGLESERAVVDALLDGLGPRDRVVVFAADQSVRSVGASAPTAVTPALRKALRQSLASLRSGGASNVALALEQAADGLDSNANGNSSMLVYLGDGWPTMGELDASAIRARLGRRATGMPRLGAVAIGQVANRWLLARLVAGSGPIYEVTERSDAARVGAALVADSLEPTLRSIDLDLGPDVDRIYPREARIALAGSTVSVVGRLRGALPKTVIFRYRDGNKLVVEPRTLERVALPTKADVARRWAAARIEEMMARGDGFEAARALAAQAKLLTPWTSWFFSSGDTLTSPAFAQRLLGLSPALDAAFAPYVETVAVSPSQLLEPPLMPPPGVTLTEGAKAAAHRSIGEAMPSFKTCRDSRAAVRPNVTSSLTIELSISPSGKATNVRVTGKPINSDDPALDRCAKRVVESLAFLGADQPFQSSHEVTIPALQSRQRSRCSRAASVPLPVRRGIWRARSVHGAERYLDAARACELPAWQDRRALLEICLDEAKTSDERLSLGTAFDAVGENEAATYVRNEALRRVTNAEELAQVSRALLQGEPEIDGVFDHAFRAAKNDEQRLDVVRRFLRIAPHHALVRRRLLMVLESIGQKDALFTTIEQIRSDPFADADLLAACASALLRLGQGFESRRVFGELVERAPADPWALAFAGDRLRAENLFDEAVSHYDGLSRMLPNDPSVSLRLALAHAGAGRLDVATRLLERVTQNGGRGDDGRLGELASITQAVLLARAREPANNEDLDAQLVRRLVQTPLPDVSSLLLVAMPPEHNGVQVSVKRERDEQAPDLAAPAIGLAAVRFERGTHSATIRLARLAEPGATRPSPVILSVLILAEERASSKVITRRIDVPPNGKPVDILWNGESLL